jgi:hypothetical protein
MNRRLALLGGLVLMLALGMSVLFRGHPTEPIDSYASCARAGYPIQDSYPPACRSGGHTYVGPYSTVTTPPPVTTVDFEIYVEGDSGGSYPQHQEVITTPAEWQQYWHTVHAALPSTPPILPVDFATSTIIALSEGRQLTTGYNLKITGITTGAAGSVVGVTESIPTLTCPVTQTATNRYLMVKTTKLTPPVSFRVTPEYRHC